MLRQDWFDCRYAYVTHTLRIRINWFSALLYTDSYVSISGWVQSSSSRETLVEVMAPTKRSIPSGYILILACRLAWLALPGFWEVTSKMNVIPLFIYPETVTRNTPCSHVTSMNISCIPNCPRQMAWLRSMWCLRSNRHNCSPFIHRLCLIACCWFTS